MSDLPLAVRRAIRDQWEAPTSPLRKSIADLKAALGYEIVPELSTNWAKTYEALAPHYIQAGEDKAAFVTTIVEFVQNFCQTLEQILAAADGEDKWVETLLEKLEATSNARRLTIDVADVGGFRPLITWVPGDHDGFWMTIPRSPPASRVEVQAGFQHDITSDTFFREDKEQAMLRANEDGWAEVSVSHDRAEHKDNAYIVSEMVKTVDRSPRTMMGAGPSSAIRRLPEVKALARPVELFKSTVPYVMIVDASSSPLVVECSHQPSLELLATYLETWAKQNNHDSLRRAVYKVALHESAFFAGVLDTMTVEPFYTMGQPQTINPTAILAFVEGVLGYKETHTTGRRWIYKLDTPLGK